MSKKHTITFTPKEAMQGKFSATLKAIAGYEQESWRDRTSGQNWSGGAVHGAIVAIRQAFEADLAALTATVRVKGDNGEQKRVAPASNASSTANSNASSK